MFKKTNIKWLNSELDARLKTEEELIKEEKDKLDKLEEDRLRRMRGEQSDQKMERRAGKIYDR